MGRLIEAGHDELATRTLPETVFELPPGGFDAELMRGRRVNLDNARTMPGRA